MFVLIKDFDIIFIYFFLLWCYLVLLYATRGVTMYNEKYLNDGYIRENDTIRGHCITCVANRIHTIYTWIDDILCKYHMWTPFFAILCISVLKQSEYPLHNALTMYSAIYRLIIKRFLLRFLRTNWSIIDWFGNKKILLRNLSSQPPRWYFSDNNKTRRVIFNWYNLQVLP